METLTSLEFAESFYQLVKTMRENPNTSRGFRTGLPFWDKLFGGVHPGWYIVVGGPEKSGKSTLLQSWAKSWNIDNVLTLYSGYEMSNIEVASRIFSNVSGVDNIKYYTMENFTDEDWKATIEAKEKISKWRGIWNYGASELDALVALIEQYDPDIVMADYFQLMTCSSHARQGRQQELSHISRTLKQIANGGVVRNGRNRVVIVGAQINREGAKQKVYNSANYFRDTGSLEQDANIAIVISPIYLPTGEEDENHRRINIVATRHSKKTHFDVRFFGERYLIAEEEIVPKKDINQIVQEELDKPMIKRNSLKKDIPW